MSKMEKIRSDLELLYYSSEESKDYADTFDKLDRILNVIESTNEKIKCQCVDAIQQINGILTEDNNEDSFSEYDAD